MYPIWIEEYLNTLATSKLLLDINNRLAFIMLDNAFEQYMYLYLIKINNEKVKYHSKLLDLYSEITKMEEDNRIRIKEFHRIRNEFYHRINSYEISKDRYEEYFRLIHKYSLYEDERFVESVDEIINDIKLKRDQKIFIKILDEKRKYRESIKAQLEDTIIDVFNLRGNYYLKGFLLSEYPGTTSSNREEIIATLNGYLESFDDRIYFLEVIESNCENPYHSFFIGRENNTTWKCFINSFWSESGEGNCRDIAMMRQFVKNNQKRINYKNVYFPKDKIKELFSKASY